jgi:hypothetical protein
MRRFLGRRPIREKRNAERGKRDEHRAQYDRALPLITIPGKDL